MYSKVRWAVGATALSAAAIALAPAAAQAQPSVCSTRAFRALDTAVNQNPGEFARLMSLTYRFAPRQTAAGFDVLAQCDVSTARSVDGAFEALNPSEANSFQGLFTRLYPADAQSVFGGGSSSGGGGGLA
jgi:hypothetical protein